jgi:predicted transcriptional regulator
MATAKEELQHLLNQLPDDVSLEQIQYHIYVKQKVHRSLEAADRGEILSQEEVEARMEKWLGK